MTASKVTEAAGPTQVGQGGLAARTVRGAAWLLAWRAASRLLGLASTLILARVLVPADFGLVAMATTFASSVDLLSQIGVQDALVRRVDDDTSLYDTAFTLQFGRSLATALITAASIPVITWWFGEPRLGAILLVLAACSVISGLENTGVAEFRRAMRFDMQFKLLLFPRLLQVAVTIPAALLLQGYWALLIGVAVSQLARTGMGYALHPFRPRLRLAGWRELAGFSFWTWASCVVGLAWEKGDLFIFGPAIGPAQLGLYLLAMELGILPVTEIIAPVADALFTAFAAAQKKGANSLHHAPLVATALVMCVMPATITISCGSGYVVAALLGPKWAAAAPLIAMLAWLCLFSPISFVCSVVLTANGFVRRNFIGKLTASAVKLVFLLTVVSLTRRLDYIAAAVTACVAVESVAYFLLLKGLGVVRIWPMAGPLARTLMAGLAVVALLWQAGLAWQEVSITSLAAIACAGLLGLGVTLAYFLLILLLWRLAGRPAGPETRIAELAVGLVRPFRAQLLRRFA